jgi:hypothetical protein
VIATWLDDAGTTALIGCRTDLRRAGGASSHLVGQWFALLSGDYYRYHVSDNGVDTTSRPSSTDLIATEAEIIDHHAPTEEPLSHYRGHRTAVHAGDPARQPSRL